MLISNLFLQISFLYFLFTSHFHSQPPGQYTRASPTTTPTDYPPSLAINHTYATDYFPECVCFLACLSLKLNAQ